MEPKASEKVHVASSQNFREIVLDSKTPVVVDFWAPWCVWCRKLAPIYDGLAASMGSDLKFVKVNVDEEGALAASYGVSSLPTLKFFCNGREIGEFVGALPKEKLAAAFHEVLRGHKECLSASSPFKA